MTAHKKSMTLFKWFWRVTDPGPPKTLKEEMIWQMKYTAFSVFCIFYWGVFSIFLMLEMAAVYKASQWLLSVGQ